MTAVTISHDSLPYQITTDISCFDMELIHRWLSTDAYWSKNIPYEVVEKAFQNSLSFAVLDSDGSTVGMARMITDEATFGYLADVYICPEERSKGLGVWLIGGIMAHEKLQGLRRTMLATGDMHALYHKFGFSEVEDSKILMEITQPDIYS